MKKTLFALSALVIATLAGCSSGGGGDSLSVNACGSLGLNARIINGTSCDTSNSPVVKITITNRNGTLGLCSGTMITPNRVLTAAHCFLTDVVRASIEANGAPVSASRVIIHPGFGENAEVGALFNDAAIMELRQNVSLPTVPIVRSRTLENGDVISIFGFGFDEAGAAEVLKSGEMLVDSVSENHIFADFNGDGSNTCNGDSGGPALVTFETENGPRTGLVGLTSTGTNPTCLEGDTSLFANVQADSIFSFIQSRVPGVGTL